MPQMPHESLLMGPLWQKSYWIYFAVGMWYRCIKWVIYWENPLIYLTISVPECSICQIISQYTALVDDYMNISNPSERRCWWGSVHTPCLYLRYGFINSLITPPSRSTDKMSDCETDKHTQIVGSNKALVGLLWIWAANKLKNIIVITLITCVQNHIII